MAVPSTELPPQDSSAGEGITMEVLQGFQSIPLEKIDLVMLEQMRDELKAAQAAAELLPEGDEGEGAAEELIGAMLDFIENLEAEQVRRLDALCLELSKDHDKAIEARKDVDARMIDDELQYQGKRRLQVSKMYPSDSTGERDTDDETTIHATRNKTEMYAARLIDMMLPTNAVPFRVDPVEDPDPECVLAYSEPAPPQPGPDGQPVPPTDPKLALDDANSRAAAKMFEKIKKQLLEGGLLNHGRRMIRDACKYGYGILEGPFPHYKRRVKVKGGKAEMVVEKESCPGLDYVDPFYWWYDMTPNMDECRKAFRLHIWDRAKLMEFKKYPNVIQYNVDKLLEQDREGQSKTDFPSNLATVIRQRNSALGMVEPIDNRWAIIKATCAISAERLKTVTGIEWQHPDTMPLVEIWWCNGKCLKFKLSPMECGWRMPYYVMTLIPIDDTVYGGGVPYLARASQRVIEGGWEATLTNAAVAAAPLLFMRKGKVTPADKKWRWRGPKQFDVTATDEGNGVDIRNYFESLVIPSNVEGNLQLVAAASKLMDEDTWFSQILQGNITEAGMAPASMAVQMINLATVFQRMLAADCDDNVWTPLSNQWNLWNLIYYPEDKESKGDFIVKGTASSALVARDIQIQHTQVALQLSDNPRFQGFTDDFELWLALTNQLEMPNKDLVNLPRDKAMERQAQLQGGGPPPELQAKQMEIESRERIEMARLQLEGQKAASAAQVDQMRIDADMQVAQLNYQAVLVKAQADSGIAMAQLANDAEKATQKEATARAKIGADAQTKMTMQERELTATPNPHSRLD